MRVNKLVYLHPSRGRPELALKSIETFIDSMKSGIPFSYILSIDDDDPKLEEYLYLYDKKSFVKAITINRNVGVVSAFNRAAMGITDEDLIFGFCDDLEPTEYWDTKLIEFIENRVTTSEYLIHISDGHTLRSDCATIPIISTSLYNKLGYFLHPAYPSHWADNDLLQTAKRLGFVYTCTDFYILHAHPDWGHRPSDEIYQRMARLAPLGQQIYLCRMFEGFPL